MAKGAYLPGEIKGMIHRIYVDNRQIRPSEARKKLLAEMEHRLSENVRAYLGENYPAVSTVSKELKELRRIDEARSPESKGLDQPWSISVLTEYPIPAEALPIVLHLWVWKRETLGHDFTVREAQWASRLYTLVKSMSIKFLMVILGMYANAERISELTGESPPGTQVLDLFMFQKMTGQALAPERIEKVLGQDEINLYANLTEEEVGLWQASLQETGAGTMATVESLEQLVKGLNSQSDSQNNRRSRENEQGHEERNQETK